MARPRKKREAYKAEQRSFYMADFETTVYEDQDHTEVWAAALVPFWSEEVSIFHSLPDFWETVKRLPGNSVIYFHNLKFDGNFILDYFESLPELREGLDLIDGYRYHFHKKQDLAEGEYSYAISDRGQWYCINVQIGGRSIEFRDSLKLLPFSVREIGKAFKTSRQKLDMEYKGRRFAGCEITPEELEYIKNDVLVVKEALEIMHSQGHDKLTIGSCCLAEFKKMLGVRNYKMLFPELNKIELSEGHGYPNADAWIRKSYRGGWCYLNPEYANKLVGPGITADVNSLYPSMLHSESGNYYPVGAPHFWTGKIPKIAKDHYYFVRFRCRFYLKPGYLPFIQIKGSRLYSGTEMLTTSDARRRDGSYSRYWRDGSGELHDSAQELTLTCTDFILMQEHYNLEDLQIIDGCWFYQQKGVFDTYIDKYKKQKLESTGALRTLAKLFLNNLYGKMASSVDSSFKIALRLESGAMGFIDQPEAEKQPGYIAVGSAITSYARNFTIRAAQLNYHPGGRGFIYADTDSIHCNLAPDEIRGIKVHPKDFCCWKLESSWDIGLFVRQKTYLEHVIAEDLEKIPEPYYSIRCAGMPQRSKDLFIESITQAGKTRPESEEEEEFIKQKREITDFKVGLSVPGKLRPVHIPGGVILMDTPFIIRPKFQFVPK